MNIWAGDLVWIDLCTHIISREQCPEALLKNYLGGRGIGIDMLLKYLGSHVQPLDPENMLVFATGLLTGTEMIASSRLHICTRSPLTGFIGTSNVGGDLAYELSLCGIRALIVTGKAERPVFIQIYDEQISIEDASHFWGATTSQTYYRIPKRNNDEKVRSLVIGPAGEHLCAFASIMTAVGHFCGRSGIGAVMGSKLLKAITVRSTGFSIRPKHPKAQQAVQKYLELAQANENYAKFASVGSVYATSWPNDEGAGVVRNFQDVTFEAIDKVAWVAQPGIVERRKGCHKCPVRCKASIKVDEGRHKGAVIERPEFETILSWGPRCGNEDGREAAYLHNLCNEYGIDSVEAGNLVAFAIDLSEHGILTSHQTGGLELTWGNVPVMEELLKQIVYRSTWLGDTLAGGINHAVAMIGNGAERYAFAVKGMTITSMDPRGFKASALGYAVCARGADYTQVYATHDYKMTPEAAFIEYETVKAADRLSEEGKALMVRKSICASALVDSIGICKILQFSCLTANALDVLTTLLRDIAEFDLTHEELFRIGERIVNAERLFNYRFGATQYDDTLPEKFLKEPLPHGVGKGSVVALHGMLDEYYALMGWDAQGNVTPEKVRELGLEEFLTESSEQYSGIQETVFCI